jgi:hypothetical protein
MLLPFNKTIVHMMGILHVYLTQQLPFFFMLTLMFYSLNMEHLNKLHDFCTSSSLEVNIYKSRIMIFGRTERKLNREAFYLDKDPITSMKALMGIVRK